MVDEHTLVPVSDLFSELIPTEWLDPAEGALSRVAIDVASSELMWENAGFWTRVHCYIIDTAELDLPLLPGFILHLGLPGQSPNFWLVVSSDPVAEAKIEDVELSLETTPDILPAWSNASGQWRAVKDESDEPRGFTVGLFVSVEADTTGYVNAGVESDLDIPYAGMIADTGFILDLTSSDSELPKFILGEIPDDLDDDVPADFRGLWLPRVRLRFIDPQTGTNLDAPSLEITDAAIGVGGFSGTLGVGTPSAPTWLTEALEEEDGEIAPALREQIEADDDLLIGELQGFVAVLYYFSLAFEQSTPAASSLRGYAFVPLIDEWMAFEIALGGPKGNFLLQLGGVGDETLVSLENDWVEITADSISYVTEDGVHFAVIDGSIRPKLPGFDWPTMQVEGLRVSSEGDVELPGGWLTLPETVTLDLYGFKLDISEIGLGTDEEASERWFGFSGEITLVKGVPLGSSVEGLRMSWPQDATPLEENLDVTLKGIGVNLEIPETLTLDGNIAYRELTPEDGRELTGPVFAGHVDIDIPPAKLQVGGELMVGSMVTEDGRQVLVLYVVVDADLPTPIPLGASGSGVHAIGALFGMHVAPDRGERSWFEWYANDAGPRLGAGEDDEGTAYDVTTVKKWAPELDNWAFGGGLTLGTLFDDGTVLNLGVFAVILIPGPVVMVEGKANLLKEIPEQPAKSGAFYALAVFDGRADTFQVNIEAAYDLAEVVSVTGSVEAFFNFADSSDWHVYLGRKTPESKRIAASILSLFDVNLYLMIGGDAIQTGAHAGFDLQERYGPVAVSFVARLSFDAGIFWKPKQLEGRVEFVGELALKVFGIGLGLLLQMLLEARTPTPFWVHGLAKIRITLPWPLPDPELQMEFTWEDEETPQPVSPPLKGGAGRHHKLPEGGWDLGTSPDAAPVIPVDSRVALSFARPLLNRSARILDDGRLEPFPPDQVDQWEFAYSYDRVEIREQGGSDPVVQYRPPSDISNVLPVDTTPHSLLPGPDAQEPTWQLWDHGPLDAAPIRWRETYTEKYSPCERTTVDRCVDWDEVATGTRYPMQFEYQGLSFMFSQRWGWSRPVVREGRLNCGTVYVRFPEPVGYLSIGVKAGDIGPSNVTLFSRGQVAEATPTYPGDDPAVRTELTFQGTDSEPLEVDAMEISISAAVTLTSTINLEHICYRTVRALAADRERNLADEDDRLPAFGAPVLEPDTPYELTVETVTSVSKGGISDQSRDESTFYFRTGTGPGTNESDAAFADTPLDELTAYIAQTIPEHGAVQAYYGYDLAVGFNEGYVDRMYETPLGIRVRDRNGALIDDATGDWRDGPLPLMPTGLLTWQDAMARGNCPEYRAEDVRSTPYLGRSAPRTGEEISLQPNRTYTAEIVTSVHGTNESLFTFQFNTSRFVDIETHLRSGLVEEPDRSSERQTVHTLPRKPGLSLDTSWTVDYDDHINEIRRLREELSTRGIDSAYDTGRLNHLAELLADTESAVAALDEFNERTFELLYDSIRTHYSAALSHRPRPPVLEFIQVPVGSAGRNALLVESPEPISWHRLSLSCESGDVRVVRNGDGTQAFVTVGTDLWLTPGEYEFTFSYGPDVAPERPPLWRDGSLVEGAVSCTVSVADEE